MTNAEAQECLADSHSFECSAEMGEALRHALVALADRAALVEACNSEDWLKRLCELSMTARRHMEGK